MARRSAWGWLLTVGACTILLLAGGASYGAERHASPTAVLAASQQALPNDASPTSRDLFTIVLGGLTGLVGVVVLGMWLRRRRRAATAVPQRRGARQPPALPPRAAVRRGPAPPPLPEPAQLMATKICPRCCSRYGSDAVLCDRDRTQLIALN